jgi:hypothetical protein
MFMAWRNKQEGISSTTVLLFLSLSQERLIAAVFFLVNMVCIDYITLNFQSRGESSSTIHGWNESLAMIYHAAAQFHANVNSLLTSDKMSVQFAALAVVQGSAFGMTLRRKDHIIDTDKSYFFTV